MKRIHFFHKLLDWKYKIVSRLYLKSKRKRIRSIIKKVKFKWKYSLTFPVTKEFINNILKEISLREKLPVFRYFSFDLALLPTAEFVFLKFVKSYDLPCFVMTD